MSTPRFFFLAALACVWTLQSKPSAGDEPVVIQVSADGSGDCRTIQEAVDKAPTGAVVRISEGVWKESVRITRPLTLEGVGWEATRIISASDSQQQPNPELMKLLEQFSRESDSDTQAKLRAAMVKVYGASPAVMVEDTQGVILRNITFLRSELVRKGSFNGSAAIDILDAAVQMEGCAILESPGTGLAAQGESHVMVKECLIANCWGKGIVVSVSEQGSFEIADSDVRNNQYSGLSISGPSKTIRVKRCRIHGAGWHGIRYDDCSPTIQGNLFYRTAVSGIYASGKTAAQVENNLFYHSGISCWFQNADSIESNTFVGDYQADDRGGITQGIQVLGASRPIVRHNVFVTCENAVFLGDIGTEAPSSKSTGEVNLLDNIFWNNERNLARYAKQAGEHQGLPLPGNNREQQPVFVDQKHRDFHLDAESPLIKVSIGARDFASFDSPWPLQPEEQRTIEAVDERLRQTSGQR